MFAVPVRRLCSLALLSACFALPTPVPAFAQSPPAPAKPAVTSAPPIAAPSEVDFDHDVRFDRLVTLDRTGISVEDLLLSLEQRDLFFTCGRSCADIKLQIRVKNRPLRTLLKAVTELLPGQWHVNKDKRTFSLTMSDAALARRETWWNLVEGEQERARAAQRAQVLATMQDPKLLSIPAGHNEAELNGAKETVSREQFFQLLPPELKQSIASHMVELATPYYTGGIDAGGVSVRIGTLPTIAKELMRSTRQLHEVWEQNPDIEKAILRFTNVGTGVGTTLIYSDGRETMAPFFLPVNPGSVY